MQPTNQGVQILHHTKYDLDILQFWMRTKANGACDSKHHPIKFNLNSPVSITTFHAAAERENAKSPTSRNHEHDL